MMSNSPTSFNNNKFRGQIFILTNGGSFSASTNFIRLLKKNRIKTNRKIFFVGEENGGDIYCNTTYARQGYNIKLSK